MRICFVVFLVWGVKDLFAAPFYEEPLMFEDKKDLFLGHFTRVFSEILEGEELSSEEAALKNLCSLLALRLPTFEKERFTEIEKNLFSFMPYVEKYVTREDANYWTQPLWKTGVQSSLKNIEVLSWQSFFETLLFSFQDIKPMFRKGPILYVFDGRLVTLTEVFEVFKTWHAHKIVHLACVQVFETIDEEHVKIKTNEFDGALEKRIRSYLLGAEDYLDPKTFTARTCVFNTMWARGIISKYINEWSDSVSKADLLRRMRGLNKEINLCF